MSTGRRVAKLESQLPHADPELKPAVAHLHPVDFRAALLFSDEAVETVLDRYNVGSCPVYFFMAEKGTSDPEDVVLHSTLGTGHEPKWMEAKTLIEHPVRPVPVAEHMELSEADRWRLAWIRYDVKLTKLKPTSQSLDDESVRAIDDVEKWLPDAITPALFEWRSAFPVLPDLDAAERLDFFPRDLPKPPGEGWREVLYEMESLMGRAGDWRNRATVDFHTLDHHEAYRLISGIEACMVVVAEAAAVEAVQGKR